MLNELAQAASAAIISSVATDAWPRLRDGVVTVWRRVYPERADAVGADLDAFRDDLLAARAGSDELSEAELRAEWQGRVRRLLVENPEIAGALRALLDEVGQSQAARGADVGEVRMTARASGNARVYQAGRDQHITER
ncbi:hypothetical protein [Streptomyces sp. XY332]|uniref:hypothetical protein n=1 Tax=Streptomyces sp. XY332 TaxID=1415561 RepID=UPI0006B1BAA4|nr:hypothetical protein [Streptomyces sp. XY332]KOY57650.1 hypothetical protein ADK59_11950 [Streptomyces sp. XY332]